MYGGINRDNIDPARVTTTDVRREAGAYLKHRRIYEDLRRAYLHNIITKQQLLTLRGQVKAGDADGAVRGLAKLMMREG